MAKASRAEALAWLKRRLGEGWCCSRGGPASKPASGLVALLAWTRVVLPMVSVSHAVITSFSPARVVTRGVSYATLMTMATKIVKVLVRGSREFHTCFVLIESGFLCIFCVVIYHKLSSSLIVRVIGFVFVCSFILFLIIYIISISQG